MRPAHMEETVRWVAYLSKRFHFMKPFRRARYIGAIIGLPQRYVYNLMRRYRLGAPPDPRNYASKVPTESDLAVWWRTVTTKGG